MDIQHTLLSKIVLEGGITTAVNARITSDFFTDDKYQRVWDYIIEHWRKYGTSADRAVMANAFPHMHWIDAPQPIQYFIDLLRQRRKKSILTDALSQSAAFLKDTDPDAMDNMEVLLREAVWQVRLETAPTLDMSLLEDSTGIETETSLDDRMIDPGFLRGISTGFNGINYVTGGLQPEQFVVMIGLPKSMKSSTLLYMALECHRHAKSPLFIGFEMSNVEQRDRLLSLISGVGLTKIITGMMVEKEKKQIMKSWRAMQGMRQFVLSTDMDSAMTVSGIQAKMMEYIPDVVFIDGAYLMMTEQPKVEQGSPQALTDIARSLKRLAQNMKTPIVVTTQASITRSKHGQLNAYSAMYTQAWQQSADVLLGVERVDQEDTPGVAEVPIRMKVLNSRGGPRAETYVIWDWSRGSVIEQDPNAFARSGTDDNEDD